MTAEREGGRLEEDFGFVSLVNQAFLIIESIIK